MAVNIFKLPDLGEGLVEASIVEWHVGEGQRVVADQPLVSVETDKAVVEIPAPWPGLLVRRCAGFGDVIAVGDPLAEFDTEAKPQAESVVGELSTAGSERKPRPERAKTRERSKSETVQAAPAARRRAVELGVELDQLAGSGPSGVITLADVERAFEASKAATGTETGLTGARRSMARAMSRAHAEVVPATVMDVADVTAWMSPDADIMQRLLRGICNAVTAESSLNGWYDAGRGVRQNPGSVDVGIAIDTPEGLYAPVLRHADRLSPAEMREEIDRLVSAAKARRLTRADLDGPSITLSNFGALAGRHAVLVVTPPQIAILGAGRVYEAPALRNGELVDRSLLPLSLTFDHRAATGGDAARFLAAVIEDLEHPDGRGRDD